MKILSVPKIDNNNLRELIHNITRKKIFVIGDLMMDEFIWGKVNRISPEAPVPVLNVTKRSFALGGAANVVNNIRALGGQIIVTGVVGQDETGDLLLNELKNKGINTNSIIRDNAISTTLKTRVIAHHQQVVRIDREQIIEINLKIKKKLFEILNKNIPISDAVIIEDYGKGMITPEIIKYILKLSKKYGKIVAVDPKQNHMSYYKGVNIITPNHHEAGTFCGIEIKDEKSLILVGKKILNLLTGGSVLITRGEYGMTLFERNGKITHIPTIAREVFDVSGAGDTVIASLTCILASGGSLIESAVISNFAAGIVVAKVGVATCSPAELISSITDFYK